VLAPTTMSVFSSMSYAHLSYTGFAGGSGLIALLFLLAFSLILLLRFPTRCSAIAAGVCLVIAVVMLNFTLAVTAGFKEMHMAGTIILALLLNIVSGPFVAVCLSSKSSVLFRLKPERVPQADGMKKSDDDTPRRNTPTVQELYSPTMPSTRAPDEQPVIEEGMPHLPTAHRIRRIRDAVVACVVPQLVAVYVGLAIVELILHIMLADACFCSAPSQLTTWATRSMQDAPCPKNEPCHAYALVGPHCSSIAVVAHYVSNNDGDAPRGATIEWARVDDGSTDASVVTAGEGYPQPARQQALRGRMVADHPIKEDWRTVAQFPLLDLDCDSRYRYTIRFYRDGSAIGEISDQFTSLPNGNQSVFFIGGGDLQVGTGGEKIFDQACQAQPHSHFIWVGGDVAYANNMRTCYRRWDGAIRILTKMRRTDGSRPLLMTAVGNHEGGGYLFTKTAAQRRSYYTHYTTFFPSPIEPLTVASPSLSPRTVTGLPPLRAFASSAPWRGDDTITFYRSYIGTTAWLVVDSNVMLTTREQVSLMNETLAYWSGLLTRGLIRKIIVAYHCPGLPTVRSLSNIQAIAVRQDFFPLIFAYNVSLVLEHHDHAYKRTKPLLAVHAGADSGVTAAPGFGVLFAGDGSLGVSENSLRDPTVRWYHEMVRAGNYIFVAELKPSGAVDFNVYNNKAQVMDHFVA
jgi:hypothetical protein